MAKATSWEVTDDFGERVKPLIPLRQRSAEQTYARKSGGGRKPKDARLVFEAIVFVLLTGCQWKTLPTKRFARASAVHARFLEWEKAGVFKALWTTGLAEYDDFEGIAGRWQSIDGAMMKAPMTQQSVGANPTDKVIIRASSLCWWTDVAPHLSLVVTGANRHDVSCWRLGLTGLSSSGLVHHKDSTSTYVLMRATQECQHLE